MRRQGFWGQGGVGGELLWHGNPAGCSAPRLPPEPLGRRKRMQPQPLSAGKRARAPTEKPLALLPIPSLRPRACGHPWDTAVLFNLFFNTFHICSKPPPLLGVFYTGSAPRRASLAARVSGEAQGAGTWGLSHHRQHHSSTSHEGPGPLLQTQGCLPALSVGSSVPGGRGS